MIQRIVLMVITCMAMISPAVADEVKFLASAPKQVIQGQQFQVIYTLQNAGGNDFRAPDFSGFSVLYGPATSQSTSVSWVNGKTSKISEYAYTYTLRADKEGSLYVRRCDNNGRRKTIIVQFAEGSGFTSR